MKLYITVVFFHYIDDLEDPYYQGCNTPHQALVALHKESTYKS